MLENLVDYYIDLDTTTKPELKLMKTVLMKKEDWLNWGRPTNGKETVHLLLPECSGEKAADFAKHCEAIQTGLPGRGFDLWYSAMFVNRITTPPVSH